MVVINGTSEHYNAFRFFGQDTVTCAIVSAEQITCNGTEFDLLEEKLRPGDTLFWVYLGVYIALVLFGGLMAGLTIAILSLDLTSLKVLQAAGTEENRRYAKRILPMVNRRHLILVTLVLANAACVEAMPIFMDRISDPITAILVSCTAVLIFGEVLPQSICSRYGLKVGYYMSWLVWTLTFLFFLIALPFSYLLDFVLGKESGTFYGRKELEALVDIHGPKQKAAEPVQRKNMASCGRGRVEFRHERLTIDEVLIIKGALTMTHKIASTAMVKLEDVFMLSIDTVFNLQIMKLIFELGHSRIPVYEGDRQNVVGVFLTKRLIAIDPNQSVTLHNLIEESANSDRKAFYPGLRVDENIHMYELLNRFQTGTMSHMAFVTSKSDETSEKIIGIVTLEDVIEELLQEEILDEADLKFDKCDCVKQMAVPKWYLQLNTGAVTKVEGAPANKATATRPLRNLSLVPVTSSMPALKKVNIASRIRSGNSISEAKSLAPVENGKANVVRLRIVDESKDAVSEDEKSVDELSAVDLHKNSAILFDQQVTTEKS